MSSHQSDVYRPHHPPRSDPPHGRLQRRRISRQLAKASLNPLRQKRNSTAKESTCSPSATTAPRGDANQVAVATGMAKFAKSLDQPLTAVLALGDNFYKPITPDRFEKHFEKMYSKDGLNCPFYACAGNHDYGPKYDPQKGKLQMQLDYAKNNPTSRWKFPAKWYTFELPSDGKPLVRVIVLDGNYWEGALTPQEKIAQRRFLKAELKKKTDAPWTWIVNHFPIFSDGKIRGDNKVLIREWGPLLKEYPVSLCFGGHDHIMQHVQSRRIPTQLHHLRRRRREALRHQADRPRLRQQPPSRLQPPPRHAR